ncbi:MAG: DNA polymerase III subunit beta, partial [Candidatus Omnitrophica bacterium]|nr:DNA polymerase III subunit beta [Candidatus Omnitrophota bacterium]
ALVSGVAGYKTNTLPILGNILLDVKSDSELFLMGTDLELGISTILEVEDVKEGAITVPGKKLHEILRELPNGKIEVMVAKNNAVNIKTGKAQFKIMGLAKDDFPKPPEFDLSNAIEIEQAVLKECLLLTSFAISHDETRYVLNGVYIQLTSSGVKFVATDGRRLAFVQKKLQGPADPIEMIVPIKATQELNRILEKEGVVKIIPGKSQTIFHFGKTILTTRLIEGHFPNYEQVIPKEEKTTSQIQREELLQAVKRAALLTSPEAQFVKFDFLKDRVLISSRSPNLGEAREEISAQINGGELAIGFNPAYLVDVLKNLDIDTVSFSLTEPDKPGLVRGKEDYLYVIMPMQLN